MSFYIPKHKILFQHIQKAGGTSIERWLRNNTDGYVLKRKKHHLRSKIEQETDLDIEWSFCVVRNPWDAVVSWYHFIGDRAQRRLKMIEYKNPSNENKKRKYDPEYNQKQLDYFNKGFENFVETAPTRSCYPKTIGNDCVMKLENLNEDFKIIQQKVGCFESLPVLNVSSRSRDYRTYYNNKTRDIVAERYKEDIDAFGYRF